MIGLIFQFAFLAAIIIVAGTILARCADAIADITGWGRLLIGSLLLAGATSLPELTVDLSAIQMGLPDLAVGDLLGSSLMNLLILAILDLSHHSRGRMLSRAAAALAILLVGPRMAHVAGQIAEQSGLGNSFVGTTFVALSTSLPELVASMAALRIGAADLAVGNVFGSNAFNMLLFVPLDMAFPGALFAHVSPAHVLSVLSVSVSSAVVIMGQLYHTESRVRFLEPDAWLVMGLIVAAFLLVYATS